MLSQYKKYINNSLWLMGERILSALLGIIVVAFVARHLGPGDFGLLSYAFSLATLFAVIGHLGLDGLIVRELVHNPDNVTTVLGTIFYMKVVAYLLAALALLFYANFLSIHSQSEKYLLYLAVIYIAITPITSFTSWFHAKVLARYVSISSSIALLLIGLGKVVLVFLGASVIAFATMNILQVFIITGIGLFFYLRIKGPPLTQWKFSRKKAIDLLSESWMVFLGSIFAVVYLKIDQVMLRWFVGVEEVGIYAIAVQLSEAAYFIPAAIVASVFPKLIELRKTDEAIYYEKLQILFDILAFIAFLVLLGGFLFGELLVSKVFGVDYQTSSSIFIIHIFAVPFIFMRFAFSRWILIEKFAVFSLISQGAGALINIILNMLLIPYYSGLGAAIATVASYAMASYFALLLSRRTQPLFKMMSRSLLMPWRGARFIFLTVKIKT